jgi:hypothetical protein
LRGVVEEIRAKKAELYVIGNGRASQAKAFHEEQEMTSPLLTDPSLRTYRAAGFKSGIATVANVRSARRAAAALLQGFVQTRTQGTANQQGGALVIAPGGKELYRYVSREAGDHPDPKDLVRALD